MHYYGMANIINNKGVTIRAFVSENDYGFDKAMCIKIFDKMKLNYSFIEERQEFLVTDNKSLDLKLFKENEDLNNSEVYYIKGQISKIYTKEVIVFSLPMWDWRQDFKKQTFEIEGIENDDEKPFIGYSCGERWNGWECPNFEKDIADRILADIKHIYDEKNDRYILCLRDENVKLEQYITLDTKSIFELVDKEGIEIEVYEGQVIEVGCKKIKTYDIGSFNWIWTLA